MAAERAPEPTMDEILASIKRIIADEDRGAREAEARRAEDSFRDAFPTAATPNNSSPPGDEQLIADIERALQNPGSSADAAEDDILDLTKVMTEQTVSASADDDAFEPGSTLRDEAPIASVEPALPETDATFEEDDVFSLDTPESGSAGDAASGLSEEEISEAFSALDEPPEAKQEDAPAEESPGDDPWALKSAVEEDAEVLDFGRKEPSFGEAFPAVATETPEPAVDPEKEVGHADWIAEATDHPSDSQLDDPTGPFEASGSEFRVPDSESEMAILDEAQQLETGTPPEAEIAGEQPEYDLGELYREHKTHSGVFRFLHSEGMNYSQISKLTGKRYQHVRNVLIASVAASVDESGVSVSSIEGQGQKSLEDSVKEMLRPMLREWLDDNMPRILESALRDELQAGSLPKE